MASIATNLEVLVCQEDSLEDIASESDGKVAARRAAMRAWKQLEQLAPSGCPGFALPIERRRRMMRIIPAKDPMQNAVGSSWHGTACLTAAFPMKNQ
jgi:hypothetical protein